jgi:hypothetical protein
MLKRVCFSIIALLIVCGLTFGQGHNWSLADIERVIPFNDVVNSVPGLTQDQYATASLRIMLVLNGAMSPDKLLALSADEPLVVRASIVIVDALIAENTKRLKVKHSVQPWVAGISGTHPETTASAFQYDWIPSASHNKT